MKGIEVTLKGGTTRIAGSKTGVKSSFDFDEGEKVTKMSLWTGSRVDKLSLTVATQGRASFEKGGPNGTEHAQQLGNGILLGFSGTYDSNELISLAAIFKEASD